MALGNILKQSEPVFFSDFDFSFKTHPKTGDLLLLKNEESIKRSIRTILQTKYKGRRFYSNKGSGLYYRLFDNMDFITASSMESDIGVALENFEPRISVSRVTVIADERNQGYDINVYFTIINKCTEEVVNLFLKRVS